MTLKEVLDKTTQFFKQKKLDSPRLDAEILLSTALNMRRIDLYLKFDSPLTEIELEKCREFVRRRSLGEPVAYILRHKDFYGLTFQVEPGVLIPRPETELLVDAVLSWAQNQQQQALQILDLGTGSGCIGLTLLKKLPSSRATLVDSSEVAIAIAQKNANAFGVQDRAEFKLARAEDVADQIGSIDILVANPPYIALGDERVEGHVLKYEPHEALFSGKSGTELIAEWVRVYAPHLKRPGFLAFEMGQDQGGQAKAILEKTGLFDVVQIIKDLSGFDRHILGTRK